MRFLLKSSTAASRAAASAARDANKFLSKNNAHNKHAATNNITGKAWGQHCSPDCGCVLRFELQLSNEHVSSPSLSATETVAAASYHAKRVMVTKASGHSSENDENRTSSSKLKPLLTSEPSSTSQRPILTSCTCTTLHELAQQVVDHLPGRTLQQLRNDTELGVVGTRSSTAFRHTVLRENVLPALEETKGRLSWKKLDEMSSKAKQLQQQDNGNNSSGGGIHEMNTTQQHGRCFDLVEDSFLSMIHERAMPPRKDDKVHAYSPTMGGYFRMYSPSGRQQQQKQRRVPSPHSSDEDEIIDTGYATTMRKNDSLSSQSGGDWLQKSPSSYFLFGDDSSTTKSNYSDGMISLFIDYAKESIFGRGDDNLTAATSPATVKNGSSRPSNYLDLLDMYGDNHSEHVGKEEEPYDDWLDYVDTQWQGQS